MADYIKREDAISLACGVVCSRQKQRLIKYNIQCCPSADVVEVVRCENCRNYDKQDYVEFGCGEEKHVQCLCTRNNIYYFPDFFCAAGKRKDEKNETD